MNLFGHGPGRHLAQLVRAGLIAVGPDKRQFIVATIVAFVSGAVQTALVLFVTMVAFAVAARTPHHRTVVAGIVILLVLAFAAVGLSFALARMQAQLSKSASARLRSSIVRAYLGASSSYRGTLREGYLQQMIGEYCQRAETTVQQFVALWVSGATLLVVLCGAFFIGVKSAAMVLLAVAIGLAIIGPVARRIQRESGKKATANRELSAQGGQIARLADEIATFGVGDSVARQFSRRAADTAESLGKIAYRDALIPNLYQYGTLTVVIIVVGIAILLVPGRHPSLAPMAFLFIRGLGYVKQMLLSVQSGSESAPYLEAIERETETLNEHQVSRDHLPAGTFRRLAFDGVAFGYSPDRDVLRDVTFEIAPGEIVGIVGPSGGGKSTLCGLILGLRTPSRGTIFCGGVALDKITPAAWSAFTGFVPQDCKLLLASIADNIRFFREDFDAAQVEQAARAAHLHEDILAMPEGYDTMIGPGMRALSGGQRQRLSVARALLSKPRFLVLDEPTSAQDKKSEQLLSQTLQELKGATTIVLVTHRPAVLGLCDRILHVEARAVAEMPSLAASA